MHGMSRRGFGGETSEGLAAVSPRRDRHDRLRCVHNLVRAVTKWILTEDARPGEGRLPPRFGQQRDARARRPGLLRWPSWAGLRLGLGNDHSRSTWGARRLHRVQTLPGRDWSV